MHLSYTCQAPCLTISTEVDNPKADVLEVSFNYVVANPGFCCKTSTLNSLSLQVEPECEQTFQSRKRGVLWRTN